MSVVHLWHGWSLDTGSDRAWCSAEVRPGHAVGDGEIDQVTCTTCLGMASDFGGACLARLRELVEDAQLGECDAAARKRVQSLHAESMLDRLDYIAKSSVTCHAPEVNARRIAQLATVLAELVKHVAAKEQP